MNCMISICNCWRKNVRTQSSEAFQTLDNIFLLEFFSNFGNVLDEMFSVEAMALDTGKLLAYFPS